MATVGDFARHYDSLTEWVDAAVKGSGTGDDDASTWHADNWSRDDEGVPWSGTETFREAVDYARNGTWNMTERVELILADVRQSIGTIERRQPRRHMSVAGGAVSVGRYLAGEPEHMMATRLVKAPKSGRRVTLLVNVCASSGVKTTEMLTRGAALLSLVEALRIAGVPATIYVGSAHRGGSGATLDVTCQLADSSHAVDIESLSFALANPAMLRRLMFGIMEGLGTQKRKRFGVDGGGYGMPTRFTAETIAKLSPDLHIDSHMLLGAVDDTAGWVKRMLGKCGVTVTD